ncbi:MAG TPA: hypothetical protein VF453_09535 [Burkholderiaceae bacterium]
MSDTVDYDSVLGLFTPPDADKQISNASAILGSLKGQSPQVVSRTAAALASTTTHPAVAAAASQLQSDANTTMTTQTTRGHLVQHPDTNAAVDRARSALSPASVAFTPQEQATSDAMERNPWATNGFARAYASASPQDRADMLRSRTMVMPSNVDYDGVMGLFQGKPAPSNGMPAMPTTPQSLQVDQVKPGSDPYSDALYAKTGSGDYTRPGETYWQAYGRNAAYDQAMRNAGLRKPASLLDLAGNAVSGVAGAIAGGYHGLLSLGQGTSTAGTNAENTAQALTYQPTNPESRAVLDIVNSNANPLNWPGAVGHWIGDKLAEHGMPAVGAAAATLGAAAPLVLGASSKARNAVASAGRSAGTTVADLVRPAAPAAPRVEPTLEPTGVQQSSGSPASTAAAPAGARTQAQPNQAAPSPGQAAGPPGYLDPTLRVPSAPAAPRAPALSDGANGVFAEAPTPAQASLPIEEQQRRAQVLKSIGLDNARESATSGDAKQAATDFQVSRTDTPGGNAMSQVFARERQALNDYADNIVKDTGGTTMNDQSAKYSRGETIMAPLEALKDYYDSNIARLYGEADERAQGVPTQLDQFRTTLGDDSLMTNSDRVQLRSAITAYAKKLGIIGDNGSIFANGQQAETMRKYLNEQWTPQASGLIGKLKDALDDDVMQSAGEDVYGQARELRSQRARVLDDPNGIAKLMDASGPNGINRKVPVEKVADTITSLPADQLGHIVTTLKTVPDALQPQAQAALAEIKAQFAHNVAETGGKTAGQWNNKGVQRYLSGNSARLGIVFSPDEMQRFGTLNDAGNILAHSQAYPGAAAQAHNLVNAGTGARAVGLGLQSAGGAIGGTLGSVFGPVGTAGGTTLGAALGGKGAGMMNDALSMHAFNKRMVKLADLLPTSKQSGLSDVGRTR